MCLSVYIGSNTPVTEPDSLCDGGLGLEPAAWTPKPLQGYAHVYALGARRAGALGCTCLLSESIDWMQDRPNPIPDPLADIADCPFAQLRLYLEAALHGQPCAGMTCDEEGGVPWEDSEDGYAPAVLTPSLIRPGAFLFHDGTGLWAVRRFTVIHDGPSLQS